ncbi:hypothetical protein D3C78_1783800 [compost metagenome]
MCTTRLHSWIRTTVGPWLPPTASATFCWMSSDSAAARSVAILTASSSCSATSPICNANGPSLYRPLPASCSISPSLPKLTR